MIFMLMIAVVLELVKVILNVLPNAPATPPSVVEAGGWIIDQIASVVAIFNWIYTPPLLAAIMVVVVAMFTWEHIYHATVWLIRKIPMINIH